jgi:molybdopterin biosynthesis enzyme MoaB
MSVCILQLFARCKQAEGGVGRREKDGRTNALEECHARSMPGVPLQFRLLSRTRGEDGFDELFGYL